ncbi:synaptonemal complex protein 2-like isoform X2 [Sceloporus undulatus]|uniref:synaptonemal complex protein 2-like isoform X2 n=1 Tax=Sceloporus undulatus TaxID=8520 RepID=UPI001C4B7D85|nr:synaptonemal complex protein 2-like isoform X2 [Sceloporus undulatus]
MKTSKSERRLSANYKSHLFSESNKESPSTSTSEKSWILNSQKKTAPKIADYTHKRQRVRSILKVLPLSSQSSDSGHHEKKVGNSALHREKTKKRMKSNTNEHSVGVSSTPFSHVRQNGLEMVDATLPLNSPSPSDYAVAGGSTKYEAATTALLQKDNVPKAKRKLPDWSPDLNRKDSKCTERTPSSEQSTSIPFEPRKLFNSIEMEEETPKGQHLDNDDEFVSKILEEEIGGSGVVAAFERFNSDLKKMFWSRHKTIENYTQNSLKAPEQKLSALLNQIHQSRLNQLGNFHKIVLRELISLEKKTQFLASLEKDTVDKIYGFSAG